MNKLVILFMALGFILWVALAVYIVGAVPIAANNYAKHVIERGNQ